jgi:flagellar biosynthetic protein FlhB
VAEAGDKTEPGTPRQRQRARQRGQVARSVELVSAALLFTVLLLLFKLQGYTGAQFTAYFHDTAGKAEQIEITEAYLPAFIRDQALYVFRLLAPYLLLSLAVVLLANFLQVGVVFAAQPLNPDLNKINPARGFSRMFSLHALVELLKNLLKIVIVAVVGFSILYRASPGLLASVAMTPESGIAYAISVARRIAMFSCALLLVLAILDYIYQRYEFEKSIRMSKQEVKDEYKNMEGDPQIKRRIREMGRRLIMSRMFEQLKTADAVITNPAHYAVALRYELLWPAPKVVAKGKDYLALRIIRYAEELSIPVYQQASLARELYKTELEAYVPAALFKTVARVIAHLSRHDERLRRKLRGLRPKTV